jgi:hypothetical protein
MPIWLRRFTAQSIREQYEREQVAQEEAMNKANGVQKATSNSVQIPQAVKQATYSTKATKK